MPTSSSRRRIRSRASALTLVIDGMKPNYKWVEDWRIGEAPSRENDISSEFLSVFIDFWDAQGLGSKSRTTVNRYSGGLHALGGYLVEQAVSDAGSGKTADELLSEYVGPDDGPLICHGNEVWQGQIDMVCRKLYRHMNSKC